MTEKYRVHDWVKFSYSEIGQYIDEYHTDRPLRNDEIVNLLNKLSDENERLKSKINVFKECIDVANNLNNKIDELEKENENLKELVDYADDLIGTHLSKHFFRQWRNVMEYIE